VKEGLSFSFDGGMLIVCSKLEFGVGIVVGFLVGTVNIRLIWVVLSSVPGGRNIESRKLEGDALDDGTTEGSRDVEGAVLDDG